MSEIITTNYIYLLQEREFIKTKENIYKVGMTKKENLQRFNQYPKSSLLLFQMICNNCKNSEKQIIKLFKEKFKHRRDIGNEYFEGEYKSMTELIYLTIKDEINIHEESILDEEDTKSNDEDTKDKVENTKDKVEDTKDKVEDTKNNEKDTKNNEKDEALCYDICGIATFRTNQAFQRYVHSNKHKLRQENTREDLNNQCNKRHPCTTCDMYFKTKKCLQQHLKCRRHNVRMNRETTIRTFSCEGCGNKYSHRQTLHAHKSLCSVVPT